MSEETPVKSEVVTQEITPDAVPQAEKTEEVVAPAVQETPKKARTPKPKPQAQYYIPVKLGQKLTGKVKTIADFGAFIDLSMAVDGLVHISEMAHRRVTKVTDVVSEGDEVTVWVKSIDTERGRIGLTMLKPVERKYSEIAEGDVLEGEVKRIESYGVFVDVGLAREGLIHVSELAHDFVKEPSEVVSVGQTVQVKVLKIDGKKKQVNLSMKALIEPPVREEAPVVEEVEEAPKVEREEEYAEEQPMSTSMAVAFGYLEDSGKKFSKKKQAKQQHRRNKSMDDVVARTLRSNLDK